MNDRKEVVGRDVKVLTLGNSQLEIASNDEIYVKDLYDTDEVRVSIGPDFKRVRLADGSRTVITERLFEYIEHNGDWEVENDD